MTVAWTADIDDRWTVPLRGGIGRIFHFGRLPVNVQIGGHSNVVTSESGADWDLRAKIQPMCPK